ncbi:hypothetical protein [Lignipirellula cremea]|uniref:Uncharacterized protein n=1 Tax=Lignipirellula cremea TaxID=2528010 RepID=A0A518E1K0_9BACT|nr:hypothetical protein [Lignipirellula cremea]QDU97943.1 hypothetical protein Pla8534_58020 [Lignipirellula cremea]
MPARLFRLLPGFGLLVCLAVGPARAEEPAAPRVEFQRLIAHWANYADEDYMAFVREAQPQAAQIGFYGGHFWSLAHTPQYKGYPAHFPVQGLNECGDWFVQRNKALHAEKVKVIGHFNVEFLVGEPAGLDGPRGFFKFYHDLWDEKELGPKPVADPIDLLEKNAQGEPIINHSYSIGGMPEYWACLRNPHWRQVLKAWTKRAIERGVDGLIINYFYRHDCHCEHCQRGFKAYLAERYTPQELADRFEIQDLAKHQFEEIVYWHKPAESTLLRREMLRWSQISNKEAYDEVFVKYGRSLKPDLMLAQWNHLGDFSQISGDERCLLPAEMWGRDETYTWYSAGASASATDLEQHELGDVTLQARYVRGAMNDKPFVIGKYENTRIRSAIAELAANGGAPMGFYARHSDPLARAELVRYYQFLKKYQSLYEGNRSHAEVLLLYPRQSVHAGDLEPVAVFRELGQKLLEQHVLFDVLPDDLADEAALARYAHVVTTDKPDQLPPAEELSQFEAPYTVRVSASRPADGKELTLHFVNYNRTEPPRQKDGKPSPGRGIIEEQPIPVAGIKVRLKLPADFQPVRVEMVTPEMKLTGATSLELPVRQDQDGLSFELPEFLVYAVVRVLPR